MEECNHEHLKTATITKKFMEHTFKSKGKVCSDCGSELWDDGLSKEFSLWIAKQEVNNQKQYMISESMDRLMEEFITQYGCKDGSTFVRAVIAVMNNKLSDPVYSDVFSELMLSPEFQLLEDDTFSVPKKVRITNPKSLYDFELWKELMGMDDSEMIRKELMLVLVLFKNTHKKFSDFWNEHFKTYITIALSA